MEVCTDAIEPLLRIAVHYRELDRKAFLLMEAPRGGALHNRSGQAFVRVGASKRRLQGEERLRLEQSCAQSRYLWFDKQVAPDTGFNTLGERLGEPLFSVEGAANPHGP